MKPLNKFFPFTRLIGVLLGLCAFGQLPPLGATPIISQIPQHQSSSLNSNANFGVTATGIEPITYQWLFGDVILSDGGRVSGANATNLTITNLNGGDAGWYHVIVSDSSGSVTSALASLTVNLATIDHTVAPTPSGFVDSLAIQPDDKILVGGTFSSFGGQPRTRLARLNFDGTFDATFNAGITGAIVAGIYVQSDGKIVVAGNITAAGGVSRSNIARINPNGSTDPAFAPTITLISGYFIQNLAIQTDEKILIGGPFVALNNQPRVNLGRFNPDGSLDDGFNPGVLGYGYAVGEIAFQPDEKILVGGGFTNLAGQARKYLGRLNTVGTLDESFNPSPMDDVGSLTIQPDGKIIAVGSFTNTAGIMRSGLVRLNQDGSLDTGFATITNSVTAIALQTDGKILIGGDFTNIAGLPRKYIARLHAYGDVDLTFNPTISEYFATSVRRIALQRDGKILVGGQFGAVEGQWRSGFARLINPDLATETLSHATNTITWLRGGASPEVWRVVFEQSLDDITWTSLGSGARVTGGWQLTNIFPLPGASIRARGHVAGSTSASGWYVQTFVGAPAGLSNPSSRTNQANTTATFSAQFSGSQPLSYRWLKNGIPISDGVNVSGTTSSTITLSNVFGADAGNYSLWVTNDYGSRTSLVATLTVIDPVITSQPVSQVRDAGQTISFTVGTVASMPTFLWLKNGNPLLQTTTASMTLTNLQAGNGGAYRVIVSNAFGVVTSSVATLTVNLAPADTNFSVNANGWVLALAPQPDGKLLLGGDFTTITNQGIPVSRSRIARLNSDETLDATFNPGANDRILSLAVMPDGKILAVGSFTNLGGQTHNRIGRLNPDGSVDGTFNPSANNSIYVTAIQSNGAIILGGFFSSLNSQTRNRIGRLNPDGTLDTTFNPNANANVNSVILQTDGKILVGGDFSTIGGQARSRIARLNSDGTLDSTFNPFVDNSVYALALQQDGKIVVGGRFTNLGGQSRNWIGRLHTNGTTDLTFNPGATGSGSDILGIYTLAVQTDGKILAGGGFRTLGGQNTIRYLGRMDMNGAVDLGFTPQFTAGNQNFSEAIYAVALQVDGGICVGGEFVSLSGLTSSRLAKMHNSTPAYEALTNTGSAVAWLRTGSGPEIWRAEFAISTNQSDWTHLGAGQRISNGWELSSVTMPANAVMRVRGYATGGSGNGSGWPIESFSRPIILKQDGNLGVRSNQFGFHVVAGLGQTVIIDASTNLSNWSPLWTNTLDATPSYFNDSENGSIPMRFYRARLKLD